MQEIYEKLGLFYLGKESQSEDLTLYKSKDLTTHAMIIGMTGSGKTGLGIDLIEEAAIDNIPSIIIDPKGDMGNLCLAFENLSAEEFAPWVESGKDPAAVAKMWREGLQKSHQGISRVKKFAAVEKTIYTPGSSAGVGVNILGSFEAPSAEVLDDSDTLSSLINTTVSSLLALLDIEADPLSSREHLLLSNIFYHYYTQGVSLSIEDLIGYIASPPFEKVGILSLKQFYPQKDRMKLAMALNGVISSISFSSWIEGEPLDIQKMLYDADGKAKIAIFNIAHLDDAQRMFFVTLLLNAYISWMRKQRGTSSLKSILYMDEIFGFFPPSKNPPSKKPMMLLLKQARAFGTGVVLSSQNPVDIDYKGISNIGTWFVGKLQTKQDIEKVLEPLAAKSKLTKAEIAQKLATLKGREFFLKNVHQDETINFTTRWVLSYLKGPITKDDIRTLMQQKKNAFSNQKEEEIPAVSEKNMQSGAKKPILSPEIKEYFVTTDMSADSSYYPAVYVDAKVRFYNQKRAIDMIKEFSLELELYEDQQQFVWEDAQQSTLQNFVTKEPHNASFAPLPALIRDARSLKAAQKSVANYLYTTQRVELFRQKELKIESKPDQSRSDFAVDVADRVRELRDEKIEKLEKKYKKKFESLEKKSERLEQKLQKEQEDVSAKTSDTLIDVGMALFGAFFGKRSSSLSSVRRGASAFKKGRSVLKEKDDVANVEAMIAELEEDMEQLQHELEDEIANVEERFCVENYPIESFAIKPRRSDISVDDIALLWKQ
jgi:hypothetical protein